MIVGCYALENIDLINQAKTECLKIFMFYNSKDEANAIISDFFSGDSLLVDTFFSLYEYTKSRENKILIRCDESAVGLATETSVFYFYITFRYGEYIIKFNHRQREPFSSDDLDLYYYNCNKIVSYIANNEQLQLGHRAAK